MKEAAEHDERLAAELLAGRDRNLSLPPFRAVQRRASDRNPQLLTWMARLGMATAVLIVAVVLGSGITAFRNRGASSEAGTQSAVGVLTPEARCLGHGSDVAARWGPVQGVAGAFVVPANDLAAWQETRNADRGARPQSEFRSRGADPMLVCFFDGNFDSFPGRGNRAPYDRIVVIFDADGTLTLDSVGPRADLKVELPGPRP
jgi:hypothetical protein